MNKVRLAVTGGIGSGKSYVAAMLSRWRIPVYNTDEEARRLMVESERIRQDLTALLGPEAYTRDGALDKRRIASYLFASPRHAERINGLVHPVVRDDFLAWVERQERPLVAMECAILFESGFDRLVDKVLLVRAPGDVCLKRAMRRDCASEEAVKARMAAQMSDEERCAKADYIIDNDGNSDVERRLEEVLRRVVAETRVEIKLF